MPSTETGSLSSEIIHPSFNVTAGYGEAAYLFGEAVGLIKSRQGFAGFDSRNVNDRFPNVLLKSCPSITAAPAGDGQFQLHVEKTEEQANLMEDPAGRAVVLKATHPGTYAIQAIEDGMKVNFSKGDMVILLEGIGINTDKLDQLLKHAKPRIVSSHDNPEKVVEDLVFALGKHDLLPLPVLKFAVLSQRGNHAEPLRTIQRLTLARRRAEKSWKQIQQIKDSSNTAAATKEGPHQIEDQSAEDEPIYDSPIITGQVPETPSVNNLLREAQEEIVNAEVANKLAQQIQADYAGVTTAWQIHNHETPIFHSGHIDESIPATVLIDGVRPQTGTDFYNISMQYPTVKFTVHTRQGREGSFEVDFFDFLTANLLYKERDTRHEVGTIEMLPSAINNEPVDNELGIVNVFTISREHALQNVLKCAQALGISKSTLQEAVRLAFSTKYIIRAGEEFAPERFLIAQELLKSFSILGVGTA